MWTSTPAKLQENKGKRTNSYLKEGYGAAPPTQSWQNKTWITRFLLFGHDEQLNMTNTIEFQYRAEFWDKHDTTNCVKNSRHENNILYLYCVFSKIATLGHLKENYTQSKT